MAQDEPRQTPEGRLIEESAKATGRSVRRLAANAGISDTHWRHLVKGWRPGPDGTKTPVPAPALTLARMAQVVGLSAADLRGVGRDDAAELVERSDLLSTSSSMFTTGVDIGSVDAALIGGSAHGRSFAQRPGRAPRQQPDEIDLIYASSMSAREKLVRIRQVLELRALAEAEEAQQRETAPAEAEAEEQDAEIQQS